MYPFQFSEDQQLGRPPFVPESHSTRGPCGSDQVTGWSDGSVRGRCPKHITLPRSFLVLAVTMFKEHDLLLLPAIVSHIPPGLLYPFVHLSNNDNTHRDMSKAAHQPTPTRLVIIPDHVSHEVSGSPRTSSTATRDTRTRAGTGQDGSRHGNCTHIVLTSRSSPTSGEPTPPPQANTPFSSICSTSMTRGVFPSRIICRKPRKMAAGDPPPPHPMM